MQRARSPIVLCGSLSLHPVTLGASMHQAAYRALGLPWLYAPFAVRSEDLPGALAGMRALAIRGFGVSMPFKLEVIPLLDRLDAIAERIGAVNTIVNDDGVLSGFNTDAEGAARALEETVGNLRGARCLVLGAGGAARAVVHALVDRGAEVGVTSRKLDAAAALAQAAGAAARPWSERASGGEDVLVNASSAGMDTGSGPGESPLAGLSIDPRQVVMDIVYKPVETRLVEQARAAGARAIAGHRMLLHQAARQIELYTGQKAPLTAMEEALQLSQRG
jgi:shikimate dehydrogenase